VGRRILIRKPFRPTAVFRATDYKANGSSRPALAQQADSICYLIQTTFCDASNHGFNPMGVSRCHWPVDRVKEKSTWLATSSKVPFFSDTHGGPRWQSGVWSACIKKALERFWSGSDPDRIGDTNIPASMTSKTSPQSRDVSMPTQPQAN